MTTVENDIVMQSAKRKSSSTALNTWWRLLDIKVGIIPLPVLPLLVALIWGLTVTGRVPSDMLVNIAVLSVGGFLCAEAGKHLPGLRHLGAAAIFATFVPSYLVFAHILPPAIQSSITDFTVSSNFLYLFISAIIVGSIMGMDRHILVTGFFKILLPLSVGSVVAAVLGTLTGAALGLGLRHTFFFLVVPVMAGGVGEGAIPLSVGYSEILGQPSGALLAQLLPPVMLGSLMAILIAGGLNFLGQRYPALTGEGRLQPDEQLEFNPQDAPGIIPDVATIAAAGVTAVAFFLAGVLCQRLWHWPAPVTMLAITVLLKLLRAVSPALQQGAFIVYRFFATAVTYPLLFAIGVAMTPWKALIGGFTLANLITIFVTVASLIGSGFIVGKMLGMYPVDVAIVNACHGGQGGTGGVAILTAANRMQLMPFAQIATRIGGAVIVSLGLIVLFQIAV